MSLTSKNYYIIERDIFDNSVSHKEEKYQCNESEGCKITTENNLDSTRTCAKICENQEDCIGYEYCNTTKECGCYTVDKDVLLDKQFDIISKKALHKENVPKQGFKKNKKISSLINANNIDNIDVGESCNCGK